VKLSIVVAASENLVIGRGARIPWRLRDEQLALRELTMGHCLIMGRKTWDSIGRPLPGRTSIVITRDRSFSAGAEGVVIVHDFDAALAAARDLGDDEAFVFGGEAIYTLALPRADSLHLTRVHTSLEGDAFFPEIDEASWKLVNEVRHEADERNEHAFTIQRYERA
jgi:dihydrofolate reductase